MFIFERNKLNKMLKISLTIYQKMLFAPIVAIFLSILFFVHVYNQQQKSSDALGVIQNSHIPALKVSTENIYLFDALVDEMKDSVTAGELDWLVNASTYKSKLDQNLNILKGYSEFVELQPLSMLQENIDHYYANAQNLSRKLIENPDGWSGRNKLISDVDYYYQKSTAALNSIQQQLDKYSTVVFSDLVHRHKLLLLYAVIFASIIIFTIIFVTTLLSNSTKHRLKRLNQAMKQLAQGDADFSKRIEDNGRDELSELVHWFNQLSENMEASYNYIEELSVTDKLTQLFNRTKIDDIFSQELERAARYKSVFAFILIDLDHFKAVNDTYGHQVGDITLKQLAKILQRHVRQNDYVGRWGGEEFVILAPETKIAQAYEMTEKIRKVIATFDFETVGNKTASFGLTCFIEGDTQETITQRADEALYEAKRNGRNCVKIKT